jgi:peptidoglycan hydrolase-like protein with peptidoglycan-binding domain/DNA invertase Pin-like site-specific DNA recombinase
MHDHRHVRALPAGLAVAALALPAPAEGAMLKSAGWHGRPIQDPGTRVVANTTLQWPRGWSAGDVALGSGYLRPGGSERVRELQRRLVRRGYRPGRIDGRFGPRTRSAVTWFQVKHGLPRTGRGDAVTVNHLRGFGPGQRVAAETIPLEALAPAGVIASTQVGVPAPEPFAMILLALVLLVGLAGIIVWVRSALRPSTPTPEPDPAPRLELITSPAIEENPSRRPVLGYVALAWGDPAADLEDAVRGIGAWCEERGWPLARVVHDAPSESGRPRSRPGLAHALHEVAAGRAAGLVVVRLRDLTESVAEIGPLLQWFTDTDAFVIALDYRLDTASAPGRFATWTLVEISEWERGRLNGRTRPGLDAVRRGAAVRDDPELSARIAAMRSDGMSLQAIADALNAEGVPTLRGGTHWRPSSVQAATGYKRPPAKPRGVDLPGLRRAEGDDLI